MSSDKAVRRAKFEAVFDLIRDELVDCLKQQSLPNEAIAWFKQNLEYNVPGGKLNRGMSVVDSVEILKGRPLSEEEYVQAGILGWCVELLQAFFLISDDMMDSSITRRGQPCWYLASSPSITAPAKDTSVQHTHPPVGLIAINDSFMVEAAIYHLLKLHFRSQPYYINLIELFHDITLKTEIGQLVDLITATDGVVDLARFSLERHQLIVIYKTAYYSFYLPVALAMHVCNIPEIYTIKLPNGKKEVVKPYDVALSILIPLGEYFQIQDDFLDFSAPPEILGKIGTDIVDNKCSWCINMALKVCSPEQRIILEKNYGRKGDLEAGSGDDVKTASEGDAGGECEKRVKRVYEEIGLRKIYADYESNAYAQLNKLIDSIPEDGAILDEKDDPVSLYPGLKRGIFKSFLEKIYGRRK